MQYATKQKNLFKMLILKNVSCHILSKICLFIYNYVKREREKRKYMNRGEVDTIRGRY